MSSKLEVSALPEAGVKTPERRLCLAAQLGDVEVVCEAIRELRVAGRLPLALTRRDDGFVPPLVGASLYGRTACVEALLEAGADVNVLSRYDCTPALGAAQNGNCAALELLARHGADLELADIEATTPLLSAVKKGHAAVVSTLLKLGAKTTGAKEQRWPMIEAANKVTLSVCDVEEHALLEARCEIVASLARAGAPKVNGTSLFRPLVASTGPPACIKATQALLDAGADPNAILFEVGKDAAGVWGMALMRERVHLATFGKEHEDGDNKGKAPFKTALHQVLVCTAKGASAADNPCLLALLKAGADADRGIGPPSVTPLLIAVVRRDASAVRLLLEYDADPEHLHDLRALRCLQFGAPPHQLVLSAKAQRRSITTRDLAMLELGANSEVARAFAADTNNAAWNNPLTTTADEAFVEAEIDAAGRTGRLLSSRNLRMLLLHVARRNPGAFAALRRWTTKVASPEFQDRCDDPGSVELPGHESSPRPGTIARSAWVAFCGFRAGSSLAGGVETYTFRSLTDFKQRPSFLADVEWADVEPSIERDGFASMVSRGLHNTDVVEHCSCAFLDHGDVVAALTPQDGVRLANCLGAYLQDIVRYDERDDGTQMSATVLEALTTAPVAFGGETIQAYAEAWRTVGAPAALLEVVVLMWREGKRASARRWTNLLVRTFVLQAALSSSSEYWELAVEAAVGARLALEPLGLSEAPFAVVRPSFTRTLRLRCLEAHERGGRLDRAVIQARAILATTADDDRGRYALLEVGDKACSLDPSRSAWCFAETPAAYCDPSNAPTTHFILPVASAALVLALDARRLGDHADAARRFFQAMVGFPEDDVKKVVAAWYFADCQVRVGSAPWSLVRQAAANADAIEKTFAGGVYGDAITDDDFPLRANLRKLLRANKHQPETGPVQHQHERAHVAADVTQRHAEALDDYLLRVGKTPGDRRRRRSCAVCASPVARKICAACRTTNYCSDACQKVHWKTHKRHCA